MLFDVVLLSQSPQLYNRNPTSQLPGYTKEGEKGLLKAFQGQQGCSHVSWVGDSFSLDCSLPLQSGEDMMASFSGAASCCVFANFHPGWHRSRQALANLLHGTKAGFALLFSSLIETWKLLRSLAGENAAVAHSHPKRPRDWCDGESYIFLFLL